MLSLFSEKEPNQLTLPYYVKVSDDRFYEIKNNINNNKSFATKIKDLPVKTINIGTKYAADLMDQVSKNETTYDEVKTIFNQKIIKSANINALEKLSDNRTKLLKTFLDSANVFAKKFYGIKVVNDKYKVVELGNKTDDK